MLDGSGPPDLSSRRSVHIVGVAGSGMSAIATVLLGMGHRVSGSDASGGPALRRLRALGADVHSGHDPAWVGRAEILAVSSAVPGDDPEVVEALRRGIPVLRRSQLLAAICRRKRTIAVSGTHGKTSTSAMLAVLMRGAGMKPSMVIGGDIAGVGAGAAWEPDGEWLVVEADESDGTFLELGAEMVVVTSVGADHLDYFGTREAIESAFMQFAAAAPGPAVICDEDRGSASLARALQTLHEAEASGATDVAPNVLTYGRGEGATIRISDVSLQRFGAEFSLSERGEDRGRFALAVPGLHNVINATGALAAATAAGVAWDPARSALAGYRGVGRRFEMRGRAGGVTFVDDYAHNPEKVSAAIAAARDGEWPRIVAVFQPHRYTRTEALWREFGPALAGLDVLIVTDVYPAGEARLPGVTGKLIADAVEASSPAVTVYYEPSLEDAERRLSEVLRPGDLCLTMGAGDVTTLPARFVGLPTEPDGGLHGG